MIYLTKAQRKAVHAVYLRTAEVPTLNSYRKFRQQVQPGPGCVMIPFAGMVLGIERDGHTHS